MEVAASAISLGNTVTTLDRGKVPLEVAIGQKVGAAFMKVHESNGVVFHTEVSVEVVETTGLDVDDGKVAAGMNVNIWHVNAPEQKLNRHEQRIDLDQLQNPDVNHPDVDLESLVTT